MSLQTDESGQLVLEGELTFDTVPEIYRQSVHLLSTSDRLSSVDLSNVMRVDSAGLALLLEWQALARKRSSNLAFINAPSDLLRLAALSESTSLLRLMARPGV